MLVSQAKFAKEIGRSRQYVNKLVQKGIIPTYDGKRVDVAEAKRLIKEHQDPKRDAQREANEKVRKSKDLFSVSGSYKSEADMSEAEKVELARQRAILRQKQIEAKALGLDEDKSVNTELLDVKELNRLILEQDLRIKKAKADESEKLSIPIEKVEAALFSATRVVRDWLNGIPPRLAARLAAESDAHKCLKMLEVEINTQLNNLVGVLNEL